MTPSTKNPEIDRRLALALSGARAAGDHTLRYFQREDLAVELKADSSPVTIADREAEQLLRAQIQAAFPQDGIVGEEFGETAGSSGYRWILDPIDGTKSFISGVPLYGTLVGVDFENRSILGVIYIPGLQECVYAATGGGAWYVRRDEPPRPAKVSQKGKLADSLFLTSSPLTFRKTNRVAAYDKLNASVWLSRTWGDCYGYLLVATGRAEVMVDPQMSVWDAAALQPILEEAGGTFTDWTGKPTIYSGEGIATNGLVLQEVLACVK